MNSVVSERFIKCHNKLKKEKRIKSSRQFAIALDYLPQSLSEILKKRRDVTIELLRKAIEKYNMNPVFLFTGEGPMFLKEKGFQNFKVLTIVTDNDNDEKIVHVPIPAQAGYASDFDNPVFIKNLPTFTLPDYKYKVGSHRCFDVSGDSMEPTLFEGDKVICSYVEPDLWANSIKNNYVYIVITGGDVLVKRLENRLVSENQLILKSDNEYYEPYNIKVNEIKEIWYVRSKISPFLPSPNLFNNNLMQDVNELKKTLVHQSTVIKDLHSKMERLTKDT